MNAGIAYKCTVFSTCLQAIVGFVSTLHDASTFLAGLHTSVRVTGALFAASLTLLSATICFTNQRATVSVALLYTIGSGTAVNRWAETKV